MIIFSNTKYHVRADDNTKFVHENTFFMIIMIIFSNTKYHVRADDNTKSVHIDNFTDIDNNTFHYKISC